MQHAEYVQDTDTMWALITAAAEAGFISFFSLEGSRAKAMRGRSQISIVNVKQEPDIPAEGGTKSPIGAELTGTGDPSPLSVVQIPLGGPRLWWWAPP